MSTYLMKTELTFPVIAQVLHRVSEIFTDNLKL